MDITDQYEDLLSRVERACADVEAAIRQFGAGPDRLRNATAHRNAVQIELVEFIRRLGAAQSDQG
ncbi:hypothetical protein [Pandoraea pneumonica]|uniref:hypothetical protein n=1 Tax=Pandoraea pneumonica TaxID=2508299 RepID=UPI0012401F08|nr:hypothetical protein [Pandoraea pneumonica]